MTWSRRFDDPIPGMTTLREAAAYIQKLPRSKQEAPEWQIAAEALVMAAEGKGPLLLARIAMLRALNAGKPDPKLSPRKKRVKAYRIVR
jgi:hypothetical protein